MQQDMIVGNIKSNVTWHIAHTKPRQESRAAQNLQNQGFEVYMPILKTETIRLGRVHVKDEPLFNRYLFVRFDQKQSPWHVIRNTLGVNQLLRFGGQLASVSDALIDNLKAMESPHQSLYQSGEVLSVKAGPFRGLQVIYEMQDGDSRAIVLIELLNKTQRVPLGLDVLAKAS